MISLRSYLPFLARQINASPVTLYERQRELVRAKLLSKGEGVGRGSGVELSSSSVAMLLIAMLSSEALVGSARAVHRIALLRATLGKCELTGKRLFHEACGALLTSYPSGVRISGLEVSRTAPHAAINFQRGVKNFISEFGPPGSDHEALAVRATLSGAVLHNICKDLIKVLPPNNSSGVG